MMKTLQFIYKNIYKILEQHFLWSKYNLLFDTNNATIPMSACQRRIYLLEQMEGDTAAYQINMLRGFKGEVNVPLLEKIINQFITDHEIFRTTFHSEEQGPFQKIHDPFPFKIETYDMKGKTLEELNILIDNLSNLRFDVEKLCLFKIALIHQSESRFKILFKFHHLIWDGWSYFLFFTQLQTAYNRLIKSEKLINFVPKMQYQDYARLEEKRTTKIPRRITNFYKHYLSQYQPNEIKFLNKKTEGSKKASTIYGFINPAVQEQIRVQAKRYNCTLNTYLLTAFLVMLRKYSTSDMINTLIPRFSRFHPRIQKIYGPMLNALPVLQEITQDMSFETILNQVKQNLQKLLKFDKIPIDRVIEALDNQKIGPFDFLFNYISATWAKRINLHGMTACDDMILTPELPYTMTLYVTGIEHEQSNTLGLVLAYQTERISDSMAKNISEHYFSILKTVSQDPKVLVQDICLFCDHYPNPVNYLRAPALHRPFKSVPELFLEAIERYPENICIKKGSDSITYREFYLLVLNYFDLIKKHGLERNRVIVISGEKDERMIAAMMAVLSANMTFFLLDSSANPLYIESVLFQVNPIYCLLAENKEKTHQTNLKELLDESVTTIKLNRKNKLGTIQAVEDELKTYAMHIEQDDIAYLVFTSGSAGKPKGIRGSHHGLAHFINWQIKEFNITHTDVCAQITNIAFDVCLRELFTPLLSGATLLLPDIKNWMHEHNFFRWIVSNRVTFFHIVPSVFGALMSQLDQEDKSLALPDLRWVFFAGEPLSSSLVQSIREKTYGFTNMVNLYGPSETVLAKMYYIIPFKPNPGIQPIGKPIQGAEVYVLNDKLSPCGVGEPGEIVIRTPFNCKGYLKPGSSNFINNPFNNNPSDKLYKTGDIGFIDANGYINICGRRDNQIKINGIRIQLDTISNVIKTCPEVDASTVICKETPKGKQLIAFISLHNKKSDSAQAIRNVDAIIEKELPGYMMPGTIIVIEKLPTLASGKINRLALLNYEITETHEEFIAPTTETECLLHDLWSKLLGKSSFSITSQQRNLGFNSLTIIQCIIELKNILGVSIKPQDFINNPTIQKMASYIDSLDVSHNKEGMAVSKMSIQELKEILKEYSPIKPANIKTYKNAVPSNILLTGSTGFFGSYLLYTLLKKYPDSTIYCLVRSNTIEEGRKRIQGALEQIRQGFFDQKISDRIIPVNGSFEHEAFNQNAHDYLQLSKKIDVIYHCGAYVNFLYDLNSLREANVDGTYNMIKFAVHAKLKPISYVSTAGIFPATEYYSKNGFHEDISIEFEPTNDIYGGYAQSKWLAEMLIQQAAENGVPVSIYRLGRISGDSQTGYWPKHDFIYCLLDTINQLGIIPELSIKIDLIPVDVAAEILVAIESQDCYQNKAYHLVNPNRLSIKELQELLLSPNKSIKIVPYPEWREHLNKAIMTGKKIPMAPFMGLLPKQANELPRLRYDRHFYVSNVETALNGSHIKFEKISRELLMKYCDPLSDG